MRDDEKSRIRISYYVGLSLVLLLFTIYLQATVPTVFRTVLGSLNPVAVVVTSSLVGFALLRALLNSLDLEIISITNLRKFSLYGFIIALGFGVEAILADHFIIHYPKGIDVRFPESLLYYPVMGFLAEIYLHLLVLYISHLLVRKFLPKVSANTKVVLIFLPAALSEPIFQVLFITNPSVIVVSYTFVHVFLFSMVQLVIYKRLDFASMYNFRLYYYLIWHIAWGYFR